MLNLYIPNMYVCDHLVGIISMLQWEEGDTVHMWCRPIQPLGSQQVFCFLVATAYTATALFLGT